MPRTLSRLRYRTPAVRDLAFNNRYGQPRLDLERQATKYVVHHSKAHQLKLQVVVNPKARLPATGQRGNAPSKPFTLRDVIDPKGEAQHGEVIYVFRNIKTNQIIYSLGELLNDHHLVQLPFIGKHSTPPVLRPDHWAPHCVITFPNLQQGRNAYRQLREFRKLHEMAWQKNDPAWKKLPLKQRMYKIMDQRANTSADLAAVLRMQAKHGLQMATTITEREAMENKILDEKWAEIDALANAAAAKEKVADSVKWLEHQIRSLDMKLGMKHNKNAADQKRLTAAKHIQQIRLRKIQYAQRKAEQFKTMQENLTTKAAPANEEGAQAKLDDLKEREQTLQDFIANSDPTRLVKERRTDQESLASLQAEIAQLEEAFEAKNMSESRDHYIARSILPKRFKKPLPKPYTLSGVRVRWVDLRDALFASGQWPRSIEHETLAIHQGRENIALFRASDFALERDHEASRIVEDYRAEREAREAEKLRLSMPQLEAPVKKKGVLGGLFGSKSSRAEA